MAKGLPFNADFVAKQDPSTIPAGYAPVQEAFELHVDSVDPVGFESIAFGFRNVRTDAGASVDGQGEFDEMVGEWYGKRRDVTVNVDGTGIIDYRQDAFGNGITYAIIINLASPVSATIVDLTPYGDIDLAQYPTTGHTIALKLQSFPDGDLLVVEMNHDKWELVVCSIDDEDNVQNACY